MPKPRAATEVQFSDSGPETESIGNAAVSQRRGLAANAAVSPPTPRSHKQRRGLIGNAAVSWALGRW
ncbi:hypothetical protein B0H14DRAFT_3439015 [Mycena olivaceomarginata]|nr:hypothetical protein B0H14DRAFT_3439015 [Mycena olivaceomarginata]